MNPFFLLSIFILSISLNLQSTELEVKSNSGLATGYIKNGVINWDDIPYAIPPVGDLRWKAPRKITDDLKKNIINSKKDNFCIQEPTGLGGSEGNSFFSGTEDCLYLDIKKPIYSKNLLPVMFWIHGGGNTSGLKDIYDFSNMVKNHNVMVVTINYRLGPFGWFTHPSIQDFQSGIDKSSNFGTLDIIEALEWVKLNIHRFGGDPNNVTVFGESAGGHNVLSLLVSPQAKGLFHKAIFQSGYTTSYSLKDAFDGSTNPLISSHSSSNIISKLIAEKIPKSLNNKISSLQTREILKSLPAEDFFKYYTDRYSYQNIPLLIADDIVIPKIGLKNALSRKEYVHNVPVIAGSNRDEVKLWLASATYFVDLNYSLLGSIFGVPRVVIKNKDVFNVFSSYRSMAWKIRGVDIPLRSLFEAGNQNLYAYRYDWDDHRRFLIADFKELIGAAHATEIPLLAGSNALVGSYGFFIYPRGFSKRYTSKNMMRFWTNFAKTGEPGESTNNITWKKYIDQKNLPSRYMIIDNKRNLKMQSDNLSFTSLISGLYEEDALNNLEKCVLLLQMLTYVGEDLYEEYAQNYPASCSREKSEQFLKDNDEFIDY